ncbi:hypothetical protein MNBD_GAMMA14-1245 [hydrothermal vent metagenome]|uniref:Long-chain fatty acid transport protein n=1 Tax=hydrothermal vent metagenome TaxID=652676 RepID=A0A3B0YFH0_9ZZZZ
MKSTTCRAAFALCLPIGLMYPLDVAATNGLNQIGFGAESIGMAGADLAVARDTSALNTNPAGLTQIKGARLDMNLAVADTGGIRHKDVFGNDRNNTNKYPKLGNMAYARRLKGYPITVGLGLFAQGGTGNAYNNLNTAFGTRDDLSIQFRVARITPGFAWQVSDTLSIGASVVGTYADLEQDFFPDTSFANPFDPSMSFFGFRLKDMNDFNTGIKLGLMYKPNDWLTLGAAYNSKVDIKLKGQMEVNLSALGLGRVTYRDAEAKNVDQPQELGVGAAIQATDKLLVSLELTWIEWSDAVTRGMTRASNPDNPAAPPVLNNAVSYNWRDQYILAVGAAYQWNTKTVLRAGYNYGRNPIPDNNLNPLLNIIDKHHLTVGFGYMPDASWQIDGALEWSIRSDETYTNPELPFGPNAEVVGEAVTLHLRLSRNW